MSRPGDDRGSMPMVMLLTVVGLGLSLVLSSTVAQQQRTTRVDVQRIGALSAAHAGIEATVATIRAAGRPGDSGSGDVTKLPCNTRVGAGPLAAGSQRYAATGTVAGGEGGTYSSRIHYLDAAPPSGDVDWAAARALPCTPPLNRLAFALIVSTGTDGPDVRRTLTATYSFTTEFRNDLLAGGTIQLLARAGGYSTLCLAAAGTTAGSAVTVDDCNPADPRQVFVYEANLNLVLKNTQPRLCVDGGAALLPDTLVTLQPCAATTSPAQAWGNNDYSAFFLQRTPTERLCMVLDTIGTRNSPIRTRTYVQKAAPCEDIWADDKSFIPTNRVGAGRAGPGTNQLVNLDQFARCIDVTADDPSQPFLVIFPCKQNPGGEPVQFNQYWNIPEIPDGEDSAAGPIWITYDVSRGGDGRAYCMRSPGTDAAGTYINVTPCVIGGGQPPELTWTVYSDTGRRSTSYRIESTYRSTPTGGPFCLSPTDPRATPADLWNGGIGGASYNFSTSKLVLATCNGSDLQKWNAAAVSTESTLRDIVER